MHSIASRNTSVLLSLIAFAAFGMLGCGADSPSNPKTGEPVTALANAQTTGGLGAGEVSGGGGVFGTGITGGIGGGGGIGVSVTGGTGGIIGNGGSSSGTMSPPPNTSPPNNPTLEGLQSLTTSAPGAVGGQSAVGVVTLITAAPAAGVIVELSQYNDVLSIPSAVTIPAGASEATFPITTPPVTKVTPDVIVATLPTGIPSLQTVNFTVTPTAAAVSKLSTTNCTPGQPITVSLTITPPAGSHAYAGSDFVPRGSTVVDLGPAGGSDADAGIMTGVNFDSTHSSVNFFFLDAAPRTITYTFTPPATSANSTIILSGVVAFDGIAQPILGDRMIHCSS